MSHIISTHLVWSSSSFYFGSLSVFRQCIYLKYMSILNTRTLYFFYFRDRNPLSKPFSHSHHLCMCKTHLWRQNLCLLLAKLHITVVLGCLNNFLSKNSRFLIERMLSVTSLQYTNNLNLNLFFFFLFQPTTFVVFYSFLPHFTHDLLGFKSTLANSANLFQRTCELKFTMYLIYCSGAFYFV